MSIVELVLLVIFVCYAVFSQLLAKIERDKLTSKLIAKSFSDYSVHELSMAQVEKDAVRKKSNPSINVPI